MMISAVLSNPDHPDYGVVTIPFPIPHDQYAHCMELLEVLEVGDAVKADCKEKIDSFYSVLKRMEMLTVNVDELNYLAKLLERFNDYEAAQFQAMAHKLELFTPKNFINLTFCCQQATVITDFSDLAAVLDAERPETLHEAHALLRNLHNYQRITDVYDYGQQRLLDALNLNDDALTELDGFMDFERYGQLCMEHDGVVTTEFGRLRRLEPPFSEQEHGMCMM